MRLIIGISGASGVLLGYRLLQALRRQPDCEIHLVISEGAAVNFDYETDLTIADVEKLADYTYANTNLAAKISSGSFVTDGMIVIPCSMKSLSGIANGYSTNLLIRAADVCLKEGRKVVLVPREMPLGPAHLRNLQLVSQYGCAIIPPMLTFYNGSETLEAQMQHVIGKVLMQFGMKHDKFVAWEGTE